MEVGTHISRGGDGRTGELVTVLQVEMAVYKGYMLEDPYGRPMEKATSEYSVESSAGTMGTMDESAWKRTQRRGQRQQQEQREPPGQRQPSPLARVGGLTVDNTCLLYKLCCSLLLQVSVIEVVSIELVNFSLPGRLRISSDPYPGS